MSQIKTIFMLAAVSVAIAVSGCGDTNSQATFAPENGHPVGWATGHKASAKINSEPCFGCHGENLDGGIAKVSCTTSCHLGSSSAIHPEQWGIYAYARHRAYVTSQKTAADPTGTAKCATAVCHGVSLSGVAGSGPSCSSCHLGGPFSMHPVEWAPINGNYDQKQHGQYTDVHGLDSCRSTVCHGAALQGVFLSGPACAICHQ